MTYNLNCNSRDANIILHFNFFTRLTKYFILHFNLMPVPSAVTLTSLDQSLINFSYVKHKIKFLKSNPRFLFSKCFAAFGCIIFVNDLKTEVIIQMRSVCAAYTHKIFSFIKMKLKLQIMRTHRSIRSEKRNAL